MKSTGSGTSSSPGGGHGPARFGGVLRFLGAIRPLTWLAIAVVLLAFGAATVASQVWSDDDGDTVTVVHWTNGHLLRDGSGLRLLRAMAEDFNDEKHRTASGARIKIEIYDQPSALVGEDLTKRVTTGRPLIKDRPNPTLVTPSSAHWLSSVNHAAGRTIVDTSKVESQSIARAYIGIVTYSEMARCLGWPDKEIGYADIIALRDDSEGWSRYPCHKAEWGKEPLVAFTDPTTSDTGRGVLLTLYAIAARVDPQELTLSDVHQPGVVSYVTHFQTLVEHYMIGTTVLNTKIYQGPRFGHFFLMPEDNLIHLYDGTEEANINGIESKAPPISRDMVMIYPKEGSIARENCACIVDAPWVTAEQKEAAVIWRDYLREDEQQRSFMRAGFRPGTDLPVADPISNRYGLNPVPPQKVIRPEYINPAVIEEIMRSWEDVKRPAIVSLVVDTSNSMKGDKLEFATDGLKRAVDNMAGNVQVGLITFSDNVETRVPIAAAESNRSAIGEVADELHAGGNTALYDAIKAGIRMVDEAPGAAGAIRAVVVFTDGQRTAGAVCLHDLVSMMSTAERTIREFCASRDEAAGIDASSLRVNKADITGQELRPGVSRTTGIQIFFVGIGKDADLEVGRILSEATGAEFQGVAEEDLAEVMEAFSKYF